MWDTTYLITATTIADINDAERCDNRVPVFFIFITGYCYCSYLLSFSAEDAVILITAIVVSLYLN